MTETRASGDATADADVDVTIPRPEADGAAVLAAVLKSEEDWEGGKHGELVLVRPSIGATQDASLPERGHLGSDAEARADSQKRVAEWLAR